MKTIKASRLILVGAVILSIIILWRASGHAAAALGSITLTEVKCRILSPNGDGFNDKARFELDNPEQLNVGGSIFDVNGAYVANIQSGNTPDYLLWDGKDDDGQTVAGGIYIYQLEFQGKQATGTLTVAR